MKHSMVWLPLLLPTLAAAAPFRMAFKRLPKDSPIDGARRAARVAAAHRQRAMLQDEHCLIDSINTTLKTTRDIIDWGGSDQLFAKWWDEHVCLLYTSPSPRDRQKSRMPSSA